MWFYWPYNTATQRQCLGELSLFFFHHASGEGSNVDSSVQ